MQLPKPLQFVLGPEIIKGAVKAGSGLLGLEAGAKVAEGVRRGKNVKITTSGIDKIKSHLSKLDTDVANDVMINRLKKIAKGEMKATTTDLNFYTHELREMELMSKGMSYEAAHAQALKDYGIEYVRGVEEHLYTPEALKAGDSAFRMSTK